MADIVIQAKPPTSISIGAKTAVEVGTATVGEQGPPGILATEGDVFFGSEEDVAEWLAAESGTRVRYSGPTTPDTTDWFNGELWADTSNAATEVVLRVWNGTTFLPSP